MQKQYIIISMVFWLTCMHVYAGIVNATITWTGTTSSSWTTGSNWSGGSVPASNDDVIIPAGTLYSPLVATGTVVNCNSILINAGATLTVATGAVLNISTGSGTTGTASLITVGASQVTNISALLGGTINSIGGCTITSHGVVVSTQPNPTTNDIVVTDNSIAGIGTFSVTASPLQPLTTYYARAFAINCNGTSYGNEISFTTTGGGGVPSDSGFFRLTTGGVTYFSYDLLGPLATTVFPEGDTRTAYLTRDISTGLFNIASQSSFILDASQSFGYSFGYINPDVNSTGTFSFAKAPASGDKSIEIAMRSGTGASNPAQANYDDYLNTGNFTRTLTNLNCIATEITSGINTLVISRWGNPGEFVEGTITGTLYDNIKPSVDCTNSIPKAFTVEFKLRRLQ